MGVDENGIKLLLRLLRDTGLVQNVNAGPGLRSFLTDLLLYTILKDRITKHFNESLTSCDDSSKS